MAKRRWVDGEILAKMGGGLALMAIPVGSWYMGFMTMKAWIAGGIGLGLFAWGLLSIGDIKNEWE